MHTYYWVFAPPWRRRVSISPLLPLAVSAGSSLAQQAASTIRDGLSSFAEVLHKTDASADPGERHARAERSLEQFRQTAQEVLRDAGVDLSFPVTLEADVLGKLRIRGAHFQQAQIEQALSDPHWSSAFELLSDHLRAAEPDAPAAGQLRLTLGQDQADFKFR